MKLSGYSLALTFLTNVSLDLSKTYAFVQPSFHHGNNVAFYKNGLKETKLFGIMDEVNSDAFNLLGTPTNDESSSNALTEAYETFLAELVFSTNDPRMDIIDNSEKSMDEGFLTFLDDKVKSSTDVEEKMALRDLLDMINDIKQQIELSEKAKIREQEEKDAAEKERLAALEQAAAEGRAISDSDVLRRAAAVDTADLRKEMGLSPLDADIVSESESSSSSTKKSFINSELSPEIRLSYEKLVKILLPPYKAGETVDKVVKDNYDQCDAQLVKVLSERAANGDVDSQAVLDALAREQQNQVAVATEKLKAVLATGDPMRMEGMIVKMAREGKADEPFLLLLEANADQARAAGAIGPADLMMKLRNRAITENDKQSSSKEIRLLRQLMRTSDKAEREKLLEDAFTPKEQLLVPGTAENAAKAVDGDLPEEEKPMPDVAPPDFINACKAVLINFGNLGTDTNGDLTTQVKAIAAEAEIVATRIFGKGMSPQEQQDRMWKEQSTSIFDLETLELEAERMGQEVPWGREGDDEILPGFDASGRMKIGGQ